MYYIDLIYFLFAFFFSGKTFFSSSFFDFYVIWLSFSPSFELLPFTVFRHLCHEAHVTSYQWRNTDRIIQEVVCVIVLEVICNANGQGITFTSGARIP